MDLQKKLASLKEKQREIESQIQLQQDDENRVIAAAFSALLEQWPSAVTSARNDQVMNRLGVRDQKLYAAWLSRFGAETPIAAHQVSTPAECLPE